MNVLALSVHPDDETLGCGGTLLKHRAQGDELFWLILTEGYSPLYTEDVLKQAAEQVERVAAAYGVEAYYKLGFPTARLDVTPQAELIDGIRDVLATVQPEVVYLVHDGDVHTDHHAAYTATMSVLKPFYMHRFGVRKVACYETLSSTDAAPPTYAPAYRPNSFSDITPYIDRKVEIMSLYETEVQQDPLPRGPSAIRALGRVRGAAIGVEYAETFMTIREVC